MTASLAGKAIERATLRIPRWGAAHADVALVDDASIATGTRASLAIGTATYTGTVRPGGAFGGAAGYSWVAGAGRWGTVVQAVPYHDDNLVMLSAVLRDLAADAGEIGMALDMADRSLGRDWTRPTAPASDLLDALTDRQWWVAADGVTHAGPRPTPTVAPAGLSVTGYDPALRRGVVELGDDGIALLVPGIVLSAPGVVDSAGQPMPLSLGAVAVEVDGRRVAVTIWGEAVGAELLTRIVDHLTAWRRYLRANPYTVDTVAADGRVAVKPADARSAAFPDAPALGHVTGIPGASYTLQHGSEVVVVHLAGDPGSPVVWGHRAGTLPATVTLDATGDINVGASGHYLARADKVALNLDALRQAIIDLGGTVPTMADTATTQAKGK